MGLQVKLLRLQYLVLLVGCVCSAPSIKTLRTFTLEELVPPSRQFAPKRILGEWISDSTFVLNEAQSGIRKYNANEGTYENFISEENAEKIKHPIASYGKDGKFLLLTADAQKVYRYSTTARYFVYDVASGAQWALGDGQLIQAAVWSRGPASALAYVHNNNVYYVPDVTNPLSTVALTTTGVPGQVYNGITDWIYEEEVLNSDTAMWFSKEGSYLAVATFNDSLVESVSYPVYGNPATSEFQYPHLVQFKYPKVGRVNPAVSLNIFPLSGAPSPIIHVPAPTGLVGADHILAGAAWASDTSVLVLWLNRRQNASVLMKCDVITATCENKRVRREPEGWIDISSMHFDKSGSAMVDLSPAPSGHDRYYHAVLFNFTDNSSHDLSPGNHTVKEVLSWDNDNDIVYFTVSPRLEPWEQQLWSSSGGVAECVTCGQPACKYANANFAPEGKHALIMCCSSESQPRWFMYDGKKKQFNLLEKNEQLTETLSEYALPTRRFSVATLPSGAPAHIELVLPPGFDERNKYPMILKVYGGPSSVRVMDKFELDYSTYLVTNRSFILCNVDVRGSGSMGLRAMFAVNNALGTVEVDDTLEAIKYLTTKHQFIDRERVGVWGWSYGGYASAMMLAHDRDATLACAASIAPVTSWIYYDTIYTERYMGLPSGNLAGYERSDLLLQARRLKGRRFLLVHGNADDNVHYQHSMMLSKVLQHEDIEFDQMSYPDENHALYGVSRHLYHMLDRHWSECFQ